MPRTDGYLNHPVPQWLASIPPVLIQERSPQRYRNNAVSRGNSEDPDAARTTYTGMPIRSNQQLLIYIRTQPVGIEHFVRN